MKANNKIESKGDEKGPPPKVVRLKYGLSRDEQVRRIVELLANQGIKVKK